MSQDNIGDQMEQIYRDVPLDSIPWNIAEPPRLLVDAIATGEIKPCRVVDLGCGAGNYSVWLAGEGFEVTGIDISARAIEHAKALAVRKGVSCRFVVADLLGDLTAYRDRFDLAIDWELLHHIFPKDRAHYVKSVHHLLCPGGKYLSISFSERNTAFEGEGKFRVTPLGTTLYFSSEEELRDLFEREFDMVDILTTEIPGKYGSHIINLVRSDKH